MSAPAPEPASGTAPITSHLASTPSASTLLRTATTHPFLRHAGAGTLDPAKLTRWLRQDMHYTRAYVRFVGGLVALVRLPLGPGPGRAPGDEFAVTQRVLDLLVDALANIQREMRFFDKVVLDYGLDLGRHGDRLDAATRAYVDLFEDVAVPKAATAQSVYASLETGDGKNRLLAGLVVLWTTEMCYHAAWSYAQSFIDRTHSAAPTNSPPSQGEETESRAGAALHEAFIPNWTSPEFAAFVERCRGCVEDFGALVFTGSGSSVSTDDHVMPALEALYRRVLELEVDFWPDVHVA